jgi:hypothetical protein
LASPKPPDRILSAAFAGACRGTWRPRLSAPFAALNVTTDFNFHAELGRAVLDHAVGIDPPQANDAHGLRPDFTIADAPMIAPIAPRIYR